VDINVFIDTVDVERKFKVPLEVELEVINWTAPFVVTSNVYPANPVPTRVAVSREDPENIEPVNVLLASV
jgi:hypothetical protein